ncbi:carbohydrate kinase family protein [Phyllobacterium chamaecytisi]|uniref:carbohydrate kinase family protein n=1 Tax=Phyllobacterium chamaecytisi TaxID=2876082 RepID=UPI001CCA53F0|nr:PfkB family carbohydrate kinase [Phyllobacterium sp. KW56]MBZ9603304.1 PfkB family carbohydrate kinase [Phyllobacterium sp. KW56]
MKPTVNRPKIFGTGLVALDLVMGADPSTPVQSWAGGTCGNVMAIMAYLGWDAFPIARMNGDPASERARADFGAWNVHLDFANCAPTGHTPIIIQQIKQGRDGQPTHRFLWTCPHCGQRLPGYKAVTQAAVDSIVPNLDGSSVFFFDRVSRAALTLAKEASERGTLVVFEPSGKNDDRLFAEAMALAHVVKYADQRLADVGAAITNDRAALVEIQTMGADGLRYRERLSGSPSDWMSVPAYLAPALVDSCGSGDWCTGGFLAKTASRGLSGFHQLTPSSLREALRYGQALAAWNCGFEGARGGMYMVSQRHFERQIHAILKGRPALVAVDVAIAPGSLVACPACAEARPHSKRTSAKSAA